MTTRDDPFAELPLRTGHFLLESGYHTDTWLTLDELFGNPPRSNRSSTGWPSDCVRTARASSAGPLTGGAFLALAVAAKLAVRFGYTEPAAAASTEALFAAHYRLPRALEPSVSGQAVAVVDDVISAGSSVRASIASLDAAGASTVAVGALMVLGERALSHSKTRVYPSRRSSAEGSRPGHRTGVHCASKKCRSKTRWSSMRAETTRGQRRLLP